MLLLLSFCLLVRYSIPQKRADVNPVRKKAFWFLAGSLKGIVFIPLSVYRQGTTLSNRVNIIDNTPIENERKYPGQIF